MPACPAPKTLRAPKKHPRRKWAWVFCIRPQYAALLIFTAAAAAAGVWLWFCPPPVPVLEYAEQTAQLGAFLIDKDTVFETLAGGGMSVSSKRGRVVFVYLWAGWSPYCARGLPAFAAFDAGRPEAVCLYLNAGQAPEDIRAFLSEQGLSIDEARILLDTGGVLSPRVIAAEGLPVTLVYNTRGRFCKRYNGILSTRALEAAYLVASRS